MVGKFGVGLSAPPPTTTTPTTTTTPGNVGNAVTTVNVNMVEYAFQLSQTTIPSGKVTFVIKNSGADVHNFDINGVKSGAILSPGATETWTVSLAPGQYLTTCDVPFHVDRGMSGNITITP
jgi:iron uptake system component EfeO